MLMIFLIMNFKKIHNLHLKTHKLILMIHNLCNITR